MNPSRIAIAGAGRMGQAIAVSVDASADLELAGIWKRGADLESIVSTANVIVDFSLPAATDEVLAAALLHHKPLVCGVSGLNESQMQNLAGAARGVPVVYDRNMSLGIAVLQRAVKDAAAALGPEFAIEISETHHIHKKDAPSGTALKLGEAIAQARGEADTGALHFESQRVGEVPGDHEVVMRSSTERLNFGHSVTTRQVFVDGALRAMRWIVDQPPGFYSMSDVLFSN